MNDDRSFKSLDFQDEVGRREMLNVSQPGTPGLRDGPAAGRRPRARQTGCAGVGVGVG